MLWIIIRPTKSENIFQLPWSSAGDIWFFWYYSNGGIYWSGINNTSVIILVIEKLRTNFNILCILQKIS